MSAIYHLVKVLFQFFGTLWAQAFQHIIDAMHGESLRKWDHRNGNVLETERAMAVFAIQMRMLFVTRTVAIVAMCIRDRYKAYEWGNTRTGYWRIADSPISVSYTHLDVYKRQV